MTQGRGSIGARGNGTQASPSPHAPRVGGTATSHARPLRAHATGKTVLVGCGTQLAAGAGGCASMLLAKLQFACTLAHAPPTVTVSQAAPLQSLVLKILTLNDVGQTPLAVAGPHVQPHVAEGAVGSAKASSRVVG